VQVALLMYVAIIVPFRSGFEVEVVLFEFEFWLDLLADLYFMLDGTSKHRRSYTVVTRSTSYSLMLRRP
jgi:hypothetical protein